VTDQKDYAVAEENSPEMREEPFFHGHRLVGNAPARSRRGRFR
jgi:hypothetical protein